MEVSMTNMTIRIFLPSLVALVVGGCGGGSGSDAPSAGDTASNLVTVSVDAETLAVPGGDASEKASPDAQGRKLYGIVLTTIPFCIFFRIPKPEVS